MNIAEWKETLRHIDRSRDAEWLEVLETRKKEEIQFHDKNRDRAYRDQLQSQNKEDYEKYYGNRKYYANAQHSKSYLHNWIADHASGKVVLEYACGNGKHAILAAKNHAALAIGIDISHTSIVNATRDAAEAGVSENSAFLVADAENTRLPSNSVDIIICCGVLHHLDLKFAIPEMRRILAPGGVALAFESLSYNPLITLYRKMTPKMRTSWEQNHILNLRDVRFIKRYLDVSNMKFWHITSIMAPHAKSCAPILNGLDRILTRIPGIQLLSWIFTFEMSKNNDRIPQAR
jgi:ubiquinone/menaquinone biosynthesis C-methylase UbiE